MQEHKIETEFGTLWAACSEPQAKYQSNPAILCLHGTLLSSRIFESLLSSSELRENHKLIVFDYPGHGRSSDAPDPDRSYYQYAYAEAALEVLKHFDVKQVIVLGSSLGGHVALELVSVRANAEMASEIRIAGIMIVGTPPVPKQKILGLRKDADMSAMFDPEASKEDLIKLANNLTKSAPPKWFVEDFLRTNRLASATMVAQFMEGKCSDQIQIVQDFREGWIAAVYGESDPILDIDYCDSVCEGAPRLWRGKCIRLKDQVHMPFLDDPESFLVLFSDFVRDCSELQIQ